MTSTLSKILIVVLFMALLGFVGTFFFPWRLINWGQIAFAPSQTITVIGTSQTSEPNQVAQFSAGVHANSLDKDAAVTEVNEKIAVIIQSVKTFGIPDEDIKTESLSVYQSQEQYYDSTEQRNKNRPGEWQVDNTISIVLRDVDRASDLADLLTSSGATNVYGPNFSLDTSFEGSNELYEEALQDAREKAEAIALNSGKKLGAVISISETSTGGVPIPLYALERGGGAPVEPGTSTVGKSLVVIFELK